jgi:hypothetical protein
MAEPIAKPADGTTTQQAIAEALAESQYQPDEPDLESQLATFDAQLAEDEGADEGTGEGDDPSRAEPPESSAPVEGDTPFTAEELATAEKTDSYWGTDLTGIPVERKAAIIRHLSQQDGTIRKLQAKLAEPMEPAPVDDTPPEEVTDEQLLTVLGLDPEDFMDEKARGAMVALARNQLALEDQVTQLTAGEQTRAAQTAWNAQLDELESTYGKLPGTREEVLRYAIREGAVTPADLYFKLTAPVKREVESVAAAARREAAKRVESGGLKPRSSSAAPAAVKPGMNMRDAVKAAAMEAQKETGLSWKQAVRRVLTKQPGAE